MPRVCLELKLSYPTPILLMILKERNHITALIKNYVSQALPKNIRSWIKYWLKIELIYKGTGTISTEWSIR